MIDLLLYGFSNIKTFKYIAEYINYIKTAYFIIINLITFLTNEAFKLHLKRNIIHV